MLDRNTKINLVCKLCCAIAVICGIRADAMDAVSIWDRKENLKVGEAKTQAIVREIFGVYEAPHFALLNLIQQGNRYTVERRKTADVVLQQEIGNYDSVLLQSMLIIEWCLLYKTVTLTPEESFIVINSLRVAHRFPCENRSIQEDLYNRSIGYGLVELHIPHKVIFGQCVITESADTIGENLRSVILDPLKLSFFRKRAFHILIGLDFLINSCISDEVERVAHLLVTKVRE